MEQIGTNNCGGKFQWITPDGPGSPLGKWRGWRSWCVANSFGLHPSGGWKHWKYEFCVKQSSLSQMLTPKCGDYQEGLGQSRCRANCRSCCYVWRGWRAAKLKLSHLIWKILFPHFRSRELHLLPWLSAQGSYEGQMGHWLGMRDLRSYQAEPSTPRAHLGKYPSPPSFHCWLLPAFSGWGPWCLPNSSSCACLTVVIFFLYNMAMHSVGVVLGIVNFNLFSGLELWSTIFFWKCRKLKMSHSSQSNIQPKGKQ